MLETWWRDFRYLLEQINNDIVACVLIMLHAMCKRNLQVYNIKERGKRAIITKILCQKLGEI